MKAGRFRDAKRIYGDALDHEPAARAAYVREACGGDDELRKDVELLLSSREEAQSLFEDGLFDPPALPAAAPEKAAEGVVDLTGRTLSHYSVTAKIGEGGMGVVYQAHDDRLDRSVALKILPPDMVADPERRRRFIQEARAASALNHPNIITIHDIDTADGVTFIVMEHVKGKTLDQLIRRRPLRLSDTLKYGVQIADALSAAHGAGLIHRDIKPANIMATDSGLVKLLDFGLAKLNPAPPGHAAMPAARSTGRTEDGLILGTVAYMSPEQAQGLDVDARSDIFSLGAVLYEMTTGRRAFPGDTNASTLAAIVGEEPEPICRLAAETPRALERIVCRCLEKDRERRFQQVGQLKAALEGIAGDPGSGAVAAPTTIRRSRLRRRLAWTLAAVVLAAALAPTAWWTARRQPAAGPEPMVSALSMIPGSQVQPALSPDGSQVAFVWNGDIHVQFVGGTAAHQLTSSPALESGAAWSPDARRIAFLRSAESGTEVVVIPSTGGPEQLVLRSSTNCGVVLAKAFCGPAWSPDGRFLAVVDRASPRGPDSIFLLDTETREKQRLTFPPPGCQDGMSAFSPDGRNLAFSRRAGWPLSDIYVLRLTASRQAAADPVRITHDNSFIWGFDWTGDGRSIVFASSRGGVDSLWRVASSGGVPEGLPFGGNDAFWPSISRRGDRLAYSYGRVNLHLWRVAAPGAGRPGDPAASPTRISYSPRWDQQPAVSPSGQRVAWSSTHSGSHQIWVSGRGGEMPMQLTSLAAPGADMPQWSPDGRRIAFRGFSPGPKPDLYVIAAQGGAPQRLTAGAFGLSAPAWSGDGRWLYFSSDRGEGVAVWKVKSTGGPAVQVARAGTSPVPSLDGNYVYYGGLGEGVWKSRAGGAGAPMLLAEKGGPPLFESFDGRSVYYKGPDASIWKVSATGGRATAVLRAGRRAAWSVSETGVYVLDPDAAGGPAIEFTPFEGTRRAIVKLAGEADEYVEPLPGTAVTLAPSRDGRWIVYLRQDPSDRKVMLVENFR